ncbi:MAG TPA: hypothetical protein VF351_04505 [Actinomycetota bacterium]
MIATFDPLGILRTLVARGVRFVLIGGFAANLRGTADLTQDLDVCYARDAADLEAMASSLRELGARLRVAREPDADLPVQLDAATLRNGDSFTFTTSKGDFDIIGTPSGTGGYDDLEAGAQTLVAADGLSIRVASIEDLIRMKRASARTKDLLHLEHLEALRTEIELARAEGLDPRQGEPRR